MTLAEARRILLKTTVIEFAKGAGNAARACREFRVPRSSFYRWKAAYEAEGQAGLIRRKPVGKRWPN